LAPISPDLTQVAAQRAEDLTQIDTPVRVGAITEDDAKEPVPELVPEPATVKLPVNKDSKSCSSNNNKRAATMMTIIVSIMSSMIFILQASLMRRWRWNSTSSKWMSYFGQLKKRSNGSSGGNTNQTNEQENGRIL
jgi:hypothetical protein